MALTASGRPSAALPLVLIAKNVNAIFTKNGAIGQEEGAYANLNGHRLAFRRKLCYNCIIHWFFGKKSKATTVALPSPATKQGDVPFIAYSEKRRYKLPFGVISH